MALLQIRRNFQITLPVKLRHVLDLKEGDLMEAEILDNQAIQLRPRETVSKIRDFTTDEIKAWLEEDKLDNKTLAAAKKMVGANK